MQNNTYSIKANRILYAVIIGVLCVSAIVIGIVASVSRQDTEPDIGEELPAIMPEEIAPTPEISDNPVIDVNALPTFTSPLSGNVYRTHVTDSLVFSPTMNDYRTHTGIDIATSVGADVMAAADGTVSKIWTDEFMGQCIAITHNGDAITVYKNLAVELPEGIAVGTSVSAGQKIATVGETAGLESSDEPHLHFEIMVKNLYEDPLDYISKDSQSASLSKDESYEG